MHAVTECLDFREKCTVYRRVSGYSMFVVDDLVTEV